MTLTLPRYNDTEIPEYTSYMKNSSQKIIEPIVILSLSLPVIAKQRKSTARYTVLYSGGSYKQLVDLFSTESEFIVTKEFCKDV